jgi:Esterase/lipase
MMVGNDQSDRALAAFLDGPERRLLVPASPRPRRSPPADPAALPSEIGARIAALRERFDGAVTTGLRAVGMDDGRLPDGVRVEMSTIDGVPLIVAEPEAPSRAAVLHLHGGGWCLGSAVSLVPALARWALALRASVASVEYRLAPEYPHPAAVDDCEIALLGWLQRLRAQRGIRRVALSGESAGAHLALLTLLRLRRHGIGDVVGACLSYGLYDFVGGLPSRVQGELAQLACSAPPIWASRLPPTRPKSRRCACRSINCTACRRHCSWSAPRTRWRMIRC